MGINTQSKRRRGLAETRHHRNKQTNKKAYGLEDKNKDMSWEKKVWDKSPLIRWIRCVKNTTTTSHYQHLQGPVQVRMHSAQQTKVFLIAR